VLKYCNENSTWAKTIENSTTLKAEVIHAVREEMAQKLEDVIFRRTDLGTGMSPGIKALETCADLMGKELDWSKERVQREKSEVADILSRRGPWKTSSRHIQ
jgi:glycerol-3-phosphate dehydrogenase